jgi:hypothetical protein
MPTEASVQILQATAKSGLNYIGGTLKTLHMAAPNKMKLNVCRLTTPWPESD